MRTLLYMINKEKGKTRYDFDMRLRSNKKLCRGSVSTFINSIFEIGNLTTRHFFVLTYTHVEKKRVIKQLSNHMYKERQLSYTLVLLYKFYHQKMILIKLVVLTILQNLMKLTYFHLKITKEKYYLDINIRLKL